MADLLVELGVRGPLVDQQVDDLLVPLPGGQVQRVAALVVGDVGEGLVAEQRLHHLAVGGGGHRTTTGSLGSDSKRCSI